MNDPLLVDMQRFFLALSDKTRMQLVVLMADGEVSVGYLADTLGQSQPKISRHLAYLRSMGVVSTRRDGKWIYYAVNDDPSAPLAPILRETLAALRHSLPADLTPGKPFTPKAPAAHIEHVPVFYEEPPEIEIIEEETTGKWQAEEMEVFLL
jgi:DNA-binding transcriptional ArsR family regulator